jgi:hypothetical protein
MFRYGKYPRSGNVLYKHVGQEPFVSASVFPSWTRNKNHSVSGFVSDIVLTLKVSRTAMREPRCVEEHRGPVDTVLLKRSLQKKTFKTSIRCASPTPHTGHKHILGRTAIICRLEYGLKQQFQRSKYLLTYSMEQSPS